jgi:hypothetical protein
MVKLPLVACLTIFEEDGMGACTYPLLVLQMSSIGGYSDVSGAAPSFTNVKHRWLQ